MGVQFKYMFASPPDGWYEYALDGEVVRSRSRFEICRLTANLRRSKGLSVFGDGFKHVMEYMCPLLPDGFCTKPSTVPPPLTANEVKANTVALFPLRLVASDVAERRLEVCIRCPMHTRRGFCVDCTGLLDWMIRGFRGSRGRLPADRAAGVCLVEKVMAAALASVDKPSREGVVFPAGCWRAPVPPSTPEGGGPE